MGATVLTTTVKGSFSDVKARVASLRDSDSQEYGYDSYSGTWNNCPGVEDCGRVFDNRKEAENYLLEKAEKWEDALAAELVNQVRWKSDDAKKQYEVSREKNLKSSKKYQALVYKRDSFNKEVEKHLDALRKIKEAHSKKVMSSKKRCECKGCGGAIPTKKIELSSGIHDAFAHVVQKGCADLKTTLMPECPLCEAPIGLKPLVSKKIAAVLKKIEGIVAKYKKADADMKALDKKLNAKVHAQATEQTTVWLVVYVAPC